MGKETGWHAAALAIASPSLSASQWQTCTVCARLLLHYSALKPVLWVTVGIDSQLSSISVFSTDLKGFRADNLKKFTTHQSGGGRFQVWIQVRAPVCYLAIAPKGYSRRQSKVLTAKSTSVRLWPRSGTAWAGQTGEHKTQSVSDLAAVAAGSDWLAWGKHATTLVILTQIESQKGFDAL